MAPLTPPPDRGGWWHDYVCPVHGTELAHGDLLSGTFPADGAACRHGCRIDTPPVRGAWTVLAHQACALRLRHLAASADPADRDAALVGLERYAELYAELTADGERHAGAQSWMLRGRMFHQALTEAIWAVSIGHAVRSLTERGEGERLAAIRPMLETLATVAEKARAELAAQGKESSNYTAWLDAAAAVCGGGPDPALRGHPQLATRPDGWEWEGSTYYHLFVLRAYLLALRGTDPAALPAETVERLAAMIAALAGIATAYGELPELHDGPYRRTGALAELHEICLLAHQLFAGEPLVAVVGWTAARTPQPPADLEGWFSGVPLPWPRPAATADPGVHRIFPDAGFAVVRAGGIHAVLDAGPHGGSHGHQDKLSLYLYGDEGAAWQPDPGQAPYGHRHFRRYYASAAAHPAFSVDGLDQQPVDARLSSAGSGECTGAYDGVTATRALTAGPGYLLDILTIEADRDRTLTAHLRPAVPLKVVAAPGGQVRTTWGEADGPVLIGHHAASAHAEFALRPHPGPADDPTAIRQGSDWSVHGTRAVFASAYASGRSPVRELRLTDDGVTVRLDDGSAHHHATGA
ncbi:heparinase II/III domain-containing protein [Streptomyces sp. NBC_00316]|uniref:heparinase II/III domain-containing protein n=1 Tax=Streptomyces sp. NBC_00316 TaxID=2975710 RepID=UPI002E298122|nr:heparinase II/III family protein [Streptomyces sp. NBC_00316]